MKAMNWINPQIDGAIPGARFYFNLDGTIHFALVKIMKFLCQEDLKEDFLIDKELYIN